MAQYDGSIRIKTEITTKQAEVQLSTLQNRIVKTADTIESLRSKMDALKGAKIPTKEYTKLQNELDDSVKKYEELDEQVKTFQKIGMDTKSTPFRKAQDEAQELYMKIEDIRGDMFELEEAGKAFTLGSDTEEYAKLGQQLQYAENNMDVLVQKEEILRLKNRNLQDSYISLGKIARNAFSSIGKFLNKVNFYITTFSKRIKELAQKHLPLLKKQTQKTKNALSYFGGRLKSIALSLLIFNQITKIFREITNGIKEGFGNLYKDNEKFKKSIDELRASVLTLKNAFAAAFRPIVDTAIPYIKKVVDYINDLLDMFGQFVAALAGQKTYTKAIRQTAETFEDAKDAAEGYLSPLDEINKYETSKKSDESENGIMFEEIPISKNFENIAEKVKSIANDIKNVLGDLFKPISQAWNRDGKFVMDSWKYALGEVWDLIKSIGSDFLKVWQQENTVKIFENLLHIIGNIGLIVGNLARNFREAWKENETGLHILENIRDIILKIVENVRHAVEATVEWSNKLNFTPILEAFERFTKSLIPVADALSGILTDFYEKVLLPLSKWTIEKGLPELLDVFTAFNEKVDWQALRDNLAEFWEHLEPFAETVGEGLIIFIERVSDALAGFLNSQEFKNFLVTVENWMDNVTPDEVANALENIAKALVTLKIALIGYKAISAITGFLTTITKFLSFFGVGGGAAGAASGLSSIGSAIAGWAPHIVVGLAIVDVLKKIKELMEGKFDTSNWDFLDWISNTVRTAVNGWKSEFEGFKISLELWWQDTWLSNEIWKFDQWWEEKVAPWFTKEKWDKLWENVKSATVEKWNEIKTTISEKVDDIKKKTDELKEKFNSFRESTKSTFDSIKEKIGSNIDSIKDKLSSFIDKMKEAIQAVKDFFSSGFDKIKSSVSGMFGSSGDNSSYSAARKIAYPSQTVAALSNFDIPGYATGQVIPRTMKQHLAVLGDNSEETEVVSPLSTMKQALKEAMAEMGGIGGSGNIKVQVLLDKKVVGETMVSYGKIQQMSTGSNPFLLGTT